MERVAGVLELLDRPVPPADRVASLADIDRLNEWFGGYALTLREIRRVAATVDEGDAFVAVDVGGGPAAFATRLVDWARSARRAIRVIVVERDTQTLALARPVCATYPEIRLVAADAAALPIRESAAGIVTSALPLHHPRPAAAAGRPPGVAGGARRAPGVDELLRSARAVGAAVVVGAGRSWRA